MEVRLLKEHTHKGLAFAGGAVIVLEEAKAQWLIDLGVAEKNTIVSSTISKSSRRNTVKKDK